ncbi:MAG: HAD family hydrolase [Elainellaceae cyanobacterium]
MRLPAPPSNFDLQGIQLVATDVDGTLTRGGQMTPQLLHDLTRLQRADIDVILATGRSAGWVSAFAHYFPVAGAIAENGGVFCPKSGAYRLFDGAIAANLAAHREGLSHMFVALKAEVPRLQESADNAFRLTDWTFDVADLTAAELRALGDRCQDDGWGFTYSTVQCHLSNLNQTKAIALDSTLRGAYPQLSRSAVLTIGDSPNDESLFDGARFPYSVGVANIAHYWARLGHHPKFVTEAAEGDGFHEVVNAILG